MMSLEDKYFEIMNDPKKRSRAFKIITVVSYSMLMLGAIIIIWALYNN